MNVHTFSIGYETTVKTSAAEKLNYGGFGRVCAKMASKALYHIACPSHFFTQLTVSVSNI